MDTPQTMVVLTDDQQDRTRRPTRANMIAAMKWLVTGAQKGDSLFFHYSGHGSQVKDLGEFFIFFCSICIKMDFSVFILRAAKVCLCAALQHVQKQLQPQQKCRDNFILIQLHFSSYLCVIIRLFQNSSVYCFIEIKLSVVDEDDGYDETILPVDFQQAGQIVDDVSTVPVQRILPQKSYFPEEFS